MDDLAVTTSDGRMVVVDDVSFTVASGQVLGLVGESGSGKTTIALALLGTFDVGFGSPAGACNWAVGMSWPCHPLTYVTCADLKSLTYPRIQQAP